MCLRNTSAGFVLSLLVVTFTGTCLADNCDQRCRNRTMFYRCTAGTYARYTLPDCYFCTNGKCDTAVEGSDRDCIQSGRNSFQERPAGLANCNCNVGIRVEAAALTPNNDEDGYEFEDKYVCDTTVIPPEK
jgi:hypothetical protein